ncbi:hypothetical protein MMC17_004699 [Xylographa soralifera]|nr:hypothetical protein [Xylographa soralifera]
MAPLVWLITGCSSGFGEIFVQSLLARGDKVIATGRKASERLTHLADTGAKILDLDVSCSQDVLNAKVEQAIKFYGGIDVLVNNAGYVEAGLAEEVRRSGKLVFVGSIGVWIGEVGAAAYSTTKFALEGYVECLQKEIAQFGIQAVIFEPGYYRTKIFSAQNVKVSPPTHEDYNAIFAAMVAGVGAVDGKQRGDSIKCVERMIDAVKSEGMAAGRPMPKRLPLGPDAMEIIRNKCLETLQMCDEWKEFICSTDLEPEKGEVNKEHGQYNVTA